MKRLSAVLAVVVAIVAAMPSGATTIAALGLDEMISASDSIVIGRAERSSVRWVDRVLVTDVTIRVSEWIHGSGGETIVVTLPGGADFDREYPIAMEYPGAPQIYGGEEVFLFLTNDPQFGAIVTGFSQGKFSINEQGGRKVVSHDLTGASVSTGTGIVRGGPSVAESLDSFKAKVNTSAAAIKRGNR